MLENIPLELRALRQWVCADMRPDSATGLPRKWPVNPLTLELADVNDPSTWGTFGEACAVGTAIGFILTENDPYAFIDLDDPWHPKKKYSDEQRKYFEALNGRIFHASTSYAELSHSGKGVHIICRGRVEHGTKRDTVELYSSQRFVIFTGNVIRDVPIIDQQPLLDSLYSEMHAQERAEVELVDKPSSLTDDELVIRACDAANGEKVRKLCRGEWQGDYPSQSEADFALLSCLCFYGPNDEQIRRVFRSTALGQRAKAQQGDKYLNRALRKIRASEPAPVDLSGLKLPAAMVVAPPSRVAILEPGPPLPNEQHPAPKLIQPSPYTFPQGVVGEIADYLLHQAFYPVPEVALCGAIAFVAGIIGRSYNISETGLNKYICVVAVTGAGKEAAASGINKLFTAMRQFAPGIERFIGPGAFASGPGLIRVFDSQPCFMSMLGEFGKTLQAWSQSVGNPAVTQLQRALLDIYTKSGKGQLLHGSAYSDTDKNTKMVVSPALTIFGEATPETFFDSLSVQQISEGLVPRFSIVEYKGDRSQPNLNRQRDPSESLMRRLMAMAQVGLYTQNNNAVCDVLISSQADECLTAFRELADNNIRNHSEVERQLWNRAHLKALKLAGILSASTMPDAPNVPLAAAEWAVHFVKSEIAGVVDRFATNRIGSNETRYETYVREAVEAYFAMSNETKIKAYQAPKGCIGKPVIPFSYLRRRLRKIAAFSTDRRGTATAIDAALKDMCAAGILLLIPPQQCATEFQTNVQVFGVGQAW